MDFNDLIGTFVPAAKSQHSWGVNENRPPKLGKIVTSALASRAIWPNSKPWDKPSPGGCHSAQEH